MADVLAVVTDLFFMSRIRAAAQSMETEISWLTGAGPIPQGPWRLALVDLDAALDVRAVIRDLKAGGVETVVAFGPHLDTEARKAARAAGADRVLAKSKFVTELPTLLRLDRDETLR